jgi:hypothetical protein
VVEAEGRKTKDNPPSLKLRRSMKASVYEESKKTKVRHSETDSTFQLFFVTLYNYLTISNFLSVESSFHPINNTDTPLKIDIGLIKEVLKTGHSVELPATGYSMFPTLRPGDRVVVKPIDKGEYPKPGSVVVYDNSGVLVMHRLIKIIAGTEDKPIFITRGDSGIEKDKPWHMQQLAGTALTYNRDDKEHSIRSYIPSVCRYKYNQRLLWLHNRIRS